MTWFSVQSPVHFRPPLESCGATVPGGAATATNPACKERLHRTQGFKGRILSGSLGIPNHPHHNKHRQSQGSHTRIPHAAGFRSVQLTANINAASLYFAPNIHRLFSSIQSFTGDFVVLRQTQALCSKSWLIFKLEIC